MGGRTRLHRGRRRPLLGVLLLPRIGVCMHPQALSSLLPSLLQCAAAVDNLAGYYFKHQPSSESPTSAAAVRSPCRPLLSAPASTAARSAAALAAWLHIRPCTHPC